MVRQFKNFNHIAILNIDTILPDDCSIFNMVGKLNGKGLAEMWKFVDKALQEADKLEAAEPKRNMLKEKVKLGSAKETKPAYRNKFSGNTGQDHEAWKNGK